MASPTLRGDLYSLQMLLRLGPLFRPLPQEARRLLRKGLVVIVYDGVFNITPTGISLLSGFDPALRNLTWPTNRVHLALRRR